MSGLDALAEAMAMLSDTDRRQAEAARQAAKQKATQEALGARQAAQVDARMLSAAELLEERAKGRVWFSGLLKHQWDGMRFGYAAKRWLLGDGPGLGKTRQMIGWTDLIGAKRIVVVCQAEIAGQFAQEILDVAPHRRTTLLAKQKPVVRRTLLERGTAMNGILVVNFEMFRKDKYALQRIIDWQPDTVIVDEAHNMKSTRSSNYQVVEQIIMADNKCPQCGGVLHGLRDSKRKDIPCESCGWSVTHAASPILPFDRLMQAKSVRYVGLTTGTPILNSPTDLYPLLHLIDPVRFATMKDFTESFCYINYQMGGKLEFLAHGLSALKPMIAGNYIARNYDDAGIVLPPQRRVVVEVPIGDEHPDQAKIVRQIAEQAKISLESGAEHTIMHAMAWVMRKRQSVVWPAGIEIKNTDKNSPQYGEVIFRVGDEVQESAKFDAICQNIATQHLRGARQIVFSQFKTALSALERRLTEEGFRVVRYDGDTPQALRTEIKEDFYRPQGEPRWDIVLVHYRSGGTGLNLQGATVTHILDEEWNAGRRDQAYGRTHRIGQERETEVYVYRSSGRGAGVDKWMANLIKFKERIVEDFESATEADKSELLASLEQMILEDAA